MTSSISIKKKPPLRNMRYSLNGARYSGMARIDPRRASAAGRSRSSGMQTSGGGIVRAPVVIHPVRSLGAVGERDVAVVLPCHVALGVGLAGGGGGDVVRTPAHSIDLPRLRV